MRVKIEYWDSNPLTTDQINAFDEVFEILLKRYGLTAEWRYFDAASGVRTLAMVDGESRFTSLSYH